MAERSTKKIVLIVAGVIGGMSLLGCCVSCGVIGWFGNRQATAAAAQFVPLVPACSGQPVPGAAELGSGGGRVRAQAVDADGDIQPYWLPTEQRSTSLADTERVVCRGELERVDAETCSYETGIVTGIVGGQNTIQRFAYRRTVRVVAARTGAVIATRTFDGAPPEACPESGEFETGGETQTFYGDAPEDAPIQQWITEVAAAPAL